MSVWTIGVLWWLAGVSSCCHGNSCCSYSGGSESMVSDDFPSAFLSLSPDDDDGLDIDLDAMETPSDSESLPFPIYDLEGEFS